MKEYLCPDCMNNWLDPQEICECGYQCPELKTFVVIRSFSGYSRGYEKRKVRAITEEEAIKNFWFSGEEFDYEIVRDDTETTDMDAEEQ